ncbi:hypothetical protein AUJ68_00670 [Candidatus Woesearchaeota archaeon CG1_02_57_44]|nr:MAG: hypothetical protein AUJ68_00670 [Candidatus Woesearchaeota archaeon CG1_02_57_44]
MRVLLVRHGESMLNKQGILQGATDGPLSEKGTEQARLTGEQLRTEQSQDVVCIFSSPLRRARETADIIADVLHLPVQVDERIRARNLGVLEGRRKEEVQWEQRLRHHYYLPAQAPEGGELPEHMLARVKDFLDEQKTRDPDQTLLIVTHQQVVHASIAICRDVPLAGLNEVMNAVMTKLDY